MTDSFYNAAGPFTMVSHLLAQEVGLVCAAVYGAVWRHCQKKEGICKASLDTLGSEIHLDRATVMRSIKKLCELGYLTDQTPDRRNAPHTYTLAKTVALCNSSDDTGVVMRNSPEAETVAEENKSVAHNNSSTESVAHGNATVAESHLKKDSKETQDSSPYGEGGKPPPPIQEIEPELEQPAEEIENPAKHPAIQAYRSVANRYPDKATWDMIATAVGRDPPDIAFWTNVVRDYIACGWNKINVKTMLEHYKRRELPTQKASTKNGYHGTSQNNPVTDPGLETGGPPEITTPLGTAWLNKRRGSGNTT